MGSYDPEVDSSDSDRLLEAIRAVASGLSLPKVLDRIIHSACALVDARYGALGVIGTEGRLAEFVTAGVTDEERAAIGPLPEGHGILGVLIVEPKPLRLRDLTTHAMTYGFPDHHPKMCSFLGVPIVVGDTVFGNLYLCEKVGADEFSPEDEALAVALASVAAIAVENAQLHQQMQGLAVLEERERIARDLHDKVIQRVFATGMSLQSTARLADERVAERLSQAIGELDETIREIRATIFSLEGQNLTGLRAAVGETAADMVASLGFTPAVHFEGPVDTAIPPTVADQLVVALREALANVAQHAHASRVQVLVRAGSEALLRVADNGVGPTGETPRADRGRGLRNLTDRAGAFGGSCTLTLAPAGGSLLEWRVPLGT